MATILQFPRSSSRRLPPPAPDALVVRRGEGASNRTLDELISLATEAEIAEMRRRIAEDDYPRGAA